MQFSEIRFHQFRNIKTTKISLGQAREIFFVGENGQGKTNLLEALYFICYGSSFRTKNEKKLIQHGADSFSLFGVVENEEGKEEIKVVYSKEKKEIFLNGFLVRDRKELIQKFPCVVFSHEDFLFVKGEPENQRFFFDQTATMGNLLFLDTLRNYKKTLKTRNVLLVQPSKLAVMEVWEERLVEFGIEIMKTRRTLIQELSEELNRQFKKITNSELEVKINYLPSWKSETESEILSLLEEKREQDQNLGFTTVGPHRDKIQVTIDGKNAQDTASTGQFRLISLILRLFQAKTIIKTQKEAPLLLLDDVLLEIDEPKRKRFMEALPPASQIFYTFLPDNKSIDGAQFLTVRSGEVYGR